MGVTNKNIIFKLTIYLSLLIFSMTSIPNKILSKSVYYIDHK